MESRNRWYLIVSLVALGTLLLGTCFGLMLGGLIGYQSGLNAGKRAAVQESGSDALPMMPGEQSMMRGALITQVMDDSPAERAGLREGDVITAVNGIRVTAQNTLPDIIRRFEPGDRVELSLWTVDGMRTVAVQLAENPERADTAYLGVFSMPVD